MLFRSAYYVVQAPDRGIDSETRVLIVLHGWAQNARSFLRRFVGLRESNVLVVAPQGPHQFYLDLETRKVGFSWLTVYDRRSEGRRVGEECGCVGGGG